MFLRQSEWRGQPQQFIPNRGLLTGAAWQGIVGTQIVGVGSPPVAVTYTGTALEAGNGLRAVRRLAGSADYATAATTATAAEWTIIAYGYTRAFGAGAIATTAEAPGNSTYDRALSTTAGDAVTAYVFDGGTKTATTTGTVVAGVPFFAAARCTTSSLSAVLNSEIASTAVANTGFTGYASPELVCGYGGGASPTLSSAFSAAYIIKIERALSNAELRRLAANPWLIAEPQRRRLWAYTASSGTTVTPDVGSVAITGYAPTVAQSANQTVTPGVGSLGITGYAPTIAQPQAVAADVGAVSLTGYAPTVAQSDNQAVAADVGSVAITGYAPTVTQASASTSLTPDVGSLTITGYAPEVTQSLLLGADAASTKRRRRIYAGTPSKREEPQEAPQPLPPQPAPVVAKAEAPAVAAPAPESAPAVAKPAPAVRFAEAPAVAVDVSVIATQIADIEQRQAEQDRRRRVERNNRAAMAAAELLLMQ